MVCEEKENEKNNEELRIEINKVRQNLIGSQENTSISRKIMHLLEVVSQRANVLRQGHFCDTTDDDKEHMLLCAIKSFIEIKADFERLKKIIYIFYATLFI